MWLIYGCPFSQYSLSTLVNSFSMVFEYIFSWKSHMAFVTGCPCFFLHHFWMTHIDMGHPVLSIRKFTWTCWTSEKIVFCFISLWTLLLKKAWHYCLPFARNVQVWEMRFKSFFATKANIEYMLWFKIFFNIPYQTKQYLNLEVLENRL